MNVEQLPDFRRIDLNRVGMEKGVWTVRRSFGSPCATGQAEPNAGERLDSLKSNREIIFTSEC